VSSKTKSVYSYAPVFKKSVLKNGIRVITENHPYSRAVSVGFFVDIGSRDESPELSGVTHFIEHLVFKGTKKRSAFQIAESLEAVGGDLNAYTTRETTCFHATCLTEHFSLALDVLSDLIRGAKLTQKDFERERMVILQELDMAKDSPEDFGGDLYFEKVFAGDPLGAEIAGTPESLSKLKRKNLISYYHRHYTGCQLLVSAAGAVDHDDVVAKVKRALGDLDAGESVPKRLKPKYRSFEHFHQRPSEQVHLFFGMPSTSYKDPLRFDSYIVNALLGGGVTSRLYQRVREERGLVYAIYSFLQSFVDTGLLQIYAGSSAKNCLQVTDIILDETEKLRQKPPGKKEIAMYRTQLEGQILLGAEDMENRMNSLGVNEMVFGSYRPVEQVIEEIRSVNVDSVRRYLDGYFSEERLSFLGVGDLTSKQALALLAKVKHKG
jgi:predicted Zn-dependent peptidase